MPAEFTDTDLRDIELERDLPEGLEPDVSWWGADESDAEAEAVLGL
jgi:hypothetical protein